MYQNRISSSARRQRRSTEIHQNGFPVAVLSLATKSSWKNGKGEYDSRTSGTAARPG